MTQNPYDYQNRSGLLPISWEDFHGLCKALALAVAPWGPDIILPIGRAGYYPGALLAHMLQVEVCPVRVSRRERDRVVREHPAWLLEPPPLVSGRRVLVVDEISSTGETLRVVAERVAELGALEVRTVVLYAHARGAQAPDYIGLISDALIINPWDREIVVDGAFRLHPEYVGALGQLGMLPGPDFPIAAPLVSLAKG